MKFQFPSKSFLNLLLAIALVSMLTLNFLSDSLNKKISKNSNSHRDRSSHFQKTVKNRDLQMIQNMTKTNSILQLMTAYADLDHSTIANLNPNSKIVKLIQLGRIWTQIPKTNLQINPYNTTTNPKVLILVLSARNHFKARTAIRSTWAKDMNGKNIFFVIGNQYCPHPFSENSRKIFNELNGRFICQMKEEKREHILRLQNFLNHMPKNELVNNKTNSDEFFEVATSVHLMKEQYERIYNENMRMNKALIQESATHKDIVFVNQIDTYNNLTLKVYNAMMWGYENFKNTNYFMKIDDDAYLRAKGVDFLVSQYEDLLKKNGSESEFLKYCPDGKNSCNFYIGNFWHNIIRHLDSKWGDHFYKAPENLKIGGTDRYPNYVNGCGGYIISRSLLENLSKIDPNENKNKLKLYANEDTSISIWLHQFFPKLRNNTKIINSSAFGSCTIQKCEKNEERWSAERNLLVYSHNFDENRIRECHSYLERKVHETGDQFDEEDLRGRGDGEYWEGGWKLNSLANISCALVIIAQKRIF